MFRITPGFRTCIHVFGVRAKEHRPAVTRARLVLTSVIIATAAFTLPSRLAHVQTLTDHMSERTVTIHAAEKNNSLIHLHDGYELKGRKGGAGNAFAMTSADFDEDGVPDLVTGGDDQRLRFFRGNIDSIFPNSREALKRRAAGHFEEQAFLSNVSIFEVPVLPEIIMAGDFNADGHQDVLIATRSGSQMSLLTGDGRGNFSSSRPIALPGKITAMTTGEVGRPDGQTDVVVGVTADSGPKLFVFEHPEGAFYGDPEIFQLSAPANDLAIGDLDGDQYSDIAAATGNVLTVIHERGQIHPWDRMKDVNLVRPPAIVATRELSFKIVSLAIGEFTNAPGNCLAFLSDDGRLHLLSPGSPPRASRTATDAMLATSAASKFTPAGGDATRFRRGDNILDGTAFIPPPEPDGSEVPLLPLKPGDSGTFRTSKGAADEYAHAEQTQRAKAAFLKTMAAHASDLAGWKLESDIARGALALGTAEKLVVARTSISGLDDLVVADDVSNRVSIVSQCAQATGEARAERCQSGAAVTSLDSDGSPVAVLPMRLNNDALSDLVVLRRGASSPSIVMTAPTATYTVDDAGDSGGGCFVAQPCTLRGAILSARNQPGSLINFNIPGAGVHTIVVGSELPRVENAVTIDGTSQPGYSGTPLIEISGENFQTGHAIDGLKIQASNCLVRGLAINRFTAVQVQPGVLVGGNGLTLESTAFHPNNGHNIIESNFLGTDPTGRLDRGNDATGLNIFDNHNNTIGGTTASAKNVFSGNGSLNTPGAGLSLTASNNNVIKGNWIGINNDGTDKLGNSLGIYLTGFNNQVGGDEVGAGNTISGNGELRPPTAFVPGCDGAGISALRLFNADTKALVSSGNIIKGNKIGTDPSGHDPIGNCSQGIFTEPFVATTIGSVTANGRNIVSGNGWDAIWCGELDFTGRRLTEGGFCFVGGNNIGTDIGGTAAIPNTGINANPNFQFRTGKVAIANNFSFSAVGGQAGTTPGGACTGFCNLISGNNGPSSTYDPTALVVSGAGTVAIIDNFVGTTVTGDVALPNDSGVGVFAGRNFPTIYLGAIGLDQFNSEIALGNLISGNLAAGATVGGPGIFQVQGNLIGTDRAGITAIPNGQLDPFNSGLVVLSNTGIATIGSGDPVGRNIVSGNRGSGIGIYGSTSGAVTILNNYLGVNSSTSPLGNGAAGIAVFSRNKTSISGNVIQNNHNEGILVVGDSTGIFNASGVNIERNQIKNNGLLGIDLSISDQSLGNGITPNDCGDTDSGPNELQNYPVLQAPVFNGDGTVTIAGTLRSEPSQLYRIDFYSNVNADPSGYGEGETFIGTIPVITDGNGFTNINFTSTAQVPANSPITSTATNQNGSTSEFSCVAGQCSSSFAQRAVSGTCPAPMVVNITTDDHDADVTDGVCDTDFNTPQFQCSLRAAIEQANDSHALTRSISFAIPGAGVQTITPASALPSITMPVQIYGFTQGGAPGTHLIEINGVNAGEVDGLTLDTGSDGSVINELTINRFHNKSGIFIKGGNGSRVTGCYLGTNSDGLTFDNDPGHLQTVGLSMSTSNNSIGGPEAADGNLITGNSTGIVIAAGGNGKVSNNKIGTDKDGNQVSVVTGNIFGMLVSGSTGNVIGGDFGSESNVISGNTLAGILFINSANNFVRGNLIGTNRSGTIAIPNGVSGISVTASSADNIIGGVGVSDRNIISGNNADPQSSGVLIDVDAGTGNQVLGNYIGVDVTAQQALPNSFGVVLLASENIVGNASAPNVISGNSSSGIQLNAPSGPMTGTSIAGNFIGTNSSGATLPNLIGVALTGDVQSSVIKNNTISGNVNGGVAMNLGPGNSTGPSLNTVSGNKIGTNSSGTFAVPNQIGVILVQASTNTIAGNLISGNSNFGVSVGGASDNSVLTTGNIIQNNLVGTTADGAGALLNVAGGIAIFDNAQNNLIGGRRDLNQGNVISGNGDLSGQNLAVGVFIGSILANAPQNSNPTGNRIQGNRIGLQKAVDTPLPNNQGVALTFAFANEIGGTDSNLANIISGNLTDGIALRQSNENLIRGNFIGTGSSGVAAGNGGNGVLISAGSSQNTIGGLVAGAGNTIKFNGGAGVLLDPTAGSGNSIDPNVISGNQGLGIDLNGAGVPWPNDVGDADGGPNNLQNYPEFTSALINPSGDLILQYKIDSAPGNSNYGANGLYVEFFKADISSNLQGQTFLGSTNYAVADYNGGSPGVATFDAGNAVSLGIGIGDKIIATATDADGNTSEFTGTSVGIVGGAVTPAQPGQIIISEFRFRGPGGVADEFIEFYNNSNADITVSTTDGSAGWSLVAADGVVRFTIPNGIIIPAGAHYLAVNSAYSLGNYGGAGAAAGDITYTQAIPDVSGIALFRTATPANFALANRLDAAGYTGVDPLYREGPGFSTGGSEIGGNLEYSFVRTMTRATGGLPKDTDNNAADFIGVDTSGTATGQGQNLGAPGPENLSSPIVRNSQFGATLLDPQATNFASPNRVRNMTSVTNGVFGTISIRRTFTNNTGAAVTRLRFRIVEVTTFTSPPVSGQADLRALNSNDIVVTVNGNPVNVRGTTIEQPPAQAVGGGWNTSMNVGFINLQAPLANGEPLSVQFLLGVQQTGRYLFYVNIEASP